MQLRVRVVEGRQLAGNNISPVCRVSVRRQLKQTDVCPSTNSPVWNKSFVFTFNVAPADIVDDILMFEVRRRLLTAVWDRTVDFLGETCFSRATLC